MATATEQAIDARWVQKLDDGYTATGAVRTVNVNMGVMSIENWDNDKAANILLALSPVLSKAIVRSVHTVDYSLNIDES